jgi:anhydro-N-acetylmuramic acid kinase
MFKDSYKVIGVMSGTSLDGIDLAYLFFDYSDQWNFQISHTATIPYSDNWKQKLQTAIHFSKQELDELNVAYTHYLADVIQKFITSTINKPLGNCSKVSSYPKLLVLRELGL